MLVARASAALAAAGAAAARPAAQRVAAAASLAARPASSGTAAGRSAAAGAAAAAAPASARGRCAASAAGASASHRRRRSPSPPSPRHPPPPGGFLVSADGAGPSVGSPSSPLPPLPSLGSRRTASAAAGLSHVAARCASEVPAAGSGLHLECAAAGAPAPYKRTAGEDAYFIQGNAAGVFDGVGGWSDRNVDAAVYSRYLAKFTARGVQLRGPQGVAAALVDAAAATRVGGSSTAVVAGLVGDRLRGLNLGDSGLWVIRDGRVVYKSKRQQHAFNYPYQVSWGDTEVVEQAAPIDVQVRDGDWVVLASDGLFDNVWEKDLVRVMSDAMAGRGGGGVFRAKGDRAAGGRRVRPVDVAQAVLERALEASVATHYASPFAMEAKKHRDDVRLEGKPDDVTVIFCLVKADQPMAD